MSREKIIEGGIQEFSKKGYFKASMDNIAKNSGVAKGTLYYHFKNKAELFETILTEGIEFMIEEIEKTLNDNISFKEQIKIIIEKNIDLYLEHQELSRLFLNEISNGIDKEIIINIKQLKDKYVSFIAYQLKDGYTYGLIKKNHFELTAYGILGYIDSICNLYLDHPDQYSKEELCQSVMLFITNLIMEE